MDDLNSGIRKIAEELRALQEQLQQAGLLASEDERQGHRWEIARRMGSLIGRLQSYFSVHPHAPAPYRHSHTPWQAPRPD
jgi:hypothetical protein